LNDQEYKERALNAEAALEALRSAVCDLLRAKGRFHTEQNYKALQAAYDLTGPSVRASISGAEKAYQERSIRERARIDEAIAIADNLIAQHRESRDRRKLDLPYQASGLPERRQSDRRNKPRLIYNTAPIVIDAR